MDNWLELIVTNFGLAWPGWLFRGIRFIGTNDPLKLTIVGKLNNPINPNIIYKSCHVLSLNMYEYSKYH